MFYSCSSSPTFFHTLGTENVVPAVHGVRETVLLSPEKMLADAQHFLVSPYGLDSSFSETQQSGYVL